MTNSKHQLKETWYNWKLGIISGLWFIQISGIENLGKSTDILLYTFTEHVELTLYYSLKE